jgi:hypothetical protein
MMRINSSVFLTDAMYATPEKAPSRLILPPGYNIACNIPTNKFPCPQPSIL